MLCGRAGHHQRSTAGRLNCVCVAVNDPQLHYCSAPLVPCCAARRRASIHELHRTYCSCRRLSWQRRCLGWPGRAVSLSAEEHGGRRSASNELGQACVAAVGERLLRSATWAVVSRFSRSRYDVSFRGSFKLVARMPSMSIHFTYRCIP